jgi:hypothetical protein
MAHNMYKIKRVSNELADWVPAAAAKLQRREVSDLLLAQVTVLLPFGIEI